MHLTGQTVWSVHIDRKFVRNKSLKNQYKTILLTKKYFNSNELITLFLSSNFYSVLNSNSEIWHLPTLFLEFKQKLLSASETWVCTKNYPIRSNRIFFIVNIHTECNHAMPEKCHYTNMQCCYKNCIILNSRKWIVNHLIFNKQTQHDKSNFKSSNQKIKNW